MTTPFNLLVSLLSSTCRSSERCEPSYNLNQWTITFHCARDSITAPTSTAMSVLHTYIHIFLPVVFRSLNGAADITQFPDLTGTYSLERLWVPAILWNHVIKYTAYRWTLWLSEQTDWKYLIIFSYYAQCFQLSCSLKQLKNLKKLRFFKLHLVCLYNIYIYILRYMLSVCMVF